MMIRKEPRIGENNKKKYSPILPHKKSMKLHNNKLRRLNKPSKKEG